MKKHSRKFSLIVWILVASLVVCLFGCTAEEPPQTTGTSPSTESIAPTSEPDTPPASDPTTAVTDPTTAVTTKVATTAATTATTESTKRGYRTDSRAGDTFVWNDFRYQLTYDLRCNILNYVGEEKTVWLTPEGLTPPKEENGTVLRGTYSCRPPYSLTLRLFEGTPTETVVMTDGVYTAMLSYPSHTSVRHVYLLHKEWGELAENNVKFCTAMLFYNLTSLYAASEDEDVYHLYFLKDSEYLTRMDENEKYWPFREDRTALNGPVGTVTKLSHEEKGFVHYLWIHVIDENDPIYATAPAGYQPAREK